MLRVDLGAARVRDDETGQEVFSEGLGSLASLIVGIRAPLLLSDEDVLSITLRVPGIAARLGDGCKLTTGGAFLSNEALVGVLCGGRNVEGTAMAVDLQTGQIKQVDTGEILKSSDATRLARQLLDKLAQQQSELRRRLAALCQ
jgi:hypothetical protein